MEIGNNMRAAMVVRFIDQGHNVQVLCADDGGLLSVYFEHLSFISFYRLIRKAGLKMAGLKIEIGRDMVRIPQIGRTCQVCSAPGKKPRIRLLPKLFTRP